MSKDDSFATQSMTDQLVANIVANLRNDDQIDAALLDILSENIVKLVPAKTAVNDAVKRLWKRLPQKEQRSLTMTPPITIEALKLEGFRAYLQPQTVNLYRGKKPLSLAVFAPNAKGKSSLVDAFEYYFSHEATLARLGKRSYQTHAGPLAMEHVDARENGVTPAVHFWFRQDKDKFDEARPVSTAAPPLPEAAMEMVKCGRTRRQGNGIINLEKITTLVDTSVEEWNKYIDFDENEEEVGNTRKHTMV